MTEEELKEKAKNAKTAAMAAKLNSVSAPDAGEDPKPEIKAASERAQIITSDPTTYLSLKEQTAAKLTTQLASPVTPENKLTPDNETAIGPFVGFILDEELDKSKKYKSNFSTPTAQRETEIRTIETREDFNNKYDNLAYFNYEDKKIYMPKWVLSEDVQNRLAQKDNMADWSLKLKSNDPAAEIATERHENTHFLHDARGQTDADKNPYQTAHMAVDKDYVTEKTAYAVQCLTLANLYKNHKEAGIETIEINDKQYPLASILNQVPGLQEAVEQNGFDPSDPKSVSRIVKIASADWDKDCLDNYSNKQFKNTAQSSNNEMINIMNQINAAKQHQQILIDMTKNLDIGYNTKIDIPADCLADILPKKEITQDIVNKSGKTFVPNTEGLLAIDEYLTKKGLKNDEEKDQYLKTQYSNIVNRTPNADLELRDLMLACGNADNKEICYTDNLKLKDQNGILTVSNDNGNTSYPLTPLDARVDEVAQNKTNTKTTEHTAAPTQKTTSLTPTQIAALANANQR
ncbi:MAG: hypothetical protein J6C85_05930 [Alphaproteobacteria bacterium]|nr:hypothetical protein [Alphaproteobacteria bacterium]